MAHRDQGEGTRLAALTGAWICFEDEARQSLWPQKARTWAPRGHTPVVRSPGTAAGCPSRAWPASSPAGRAASSTGCASTAGARASGPACPKRTTHLVTAAHRALNAPLILVWDGLNTHRSQKMGAFTGSRENWLTVVQMPVYAPDLNAVEGAWSV